MEIDDSRREIILKIYDDYKNIFHYAEGSSFNHQAWPGGYADHIAECLRINEVIYDSLSSLRNLEFLKSSAAIILFLHDIEKPFRYGPKDHFECKSYQERAKHDYKEWETIKWEIIDHYKSYYGLVLSSNEINALKYVHGEGDDYQKNKRISTPLAAHVHHCDNISARIWFDEGKGLSEKKNLT